MTRVAGAREGDWKCSGCSNRNYAFRSLCNRCKQPRILVDNETPPNSKWRPRVGDWICSGCSNNNYASREKCNKCGEPKEVAALPAMSLPGAVLPPATQSFAPVVHPGLGMNLGFMSPQLSLGAWSRNGSGGVGGSGSLTDNLLASGSRHPGDWICACGFLNYASRTMCKRCNAPMQSPSALPPIPDPLSAPLAYHVSGYKRHASEEPIGDWLSKRPNLGADVLHHQYLLQQSQLQLFAPFGGLDERASLFFSHLPPGALNMGINMDIAPPTLHLQEQSLGGPPPSSNLGKGLKHWREGDWICSVCNNHNYASRQTCNRCNRNREGALISPQ